MSESVAKASFYGAWAERTIQQYDRIDREALVALAHTEDMALSILRNVDEEGIELPLAYLRRRRLELIATESLIREAENALTGLKIKMNSFGISRLRGAILRLIELGTNPVEVERLKKRAELQSLDLALGN